MKIVLAPDSFKESLSAKDLCRLMEARLHERRPDLEIISCPMADGGEGTAEVLVAGLHGTWIEAEVSGPLRPMRCTARYGWVSTEPSYAVIEMAAASGLPLLAPVQRNPLHTTTYGTGELLAHASQRRPHRILLGVGGSATVDGGTGAAHALGWSFLDAAGHELPPGGGALSKLHTIVPPKNSLGIPVQILCDVSNPLCGPHGAAAVFGPQKGATADAVQILEDGLLHLANCIKDQLGVDVTLLPGGGAAGGLAAGAVAFLDAVLVQGLDTLADVTGLNTALDTADWVVTGEGCFDDQSLCGKVVGGVLERAAAHDVRVAVVAGSTKEMRRAPGVEALYTLRQAGMSLEECLSRTPELLQLAIEAFVRDHLGSPV